MNRSDGFTLIEVTVMLAVVGLLVGLLTSSAGDLVQQSRVVRSRDDVERIGRAIAEFYADNGFFPRTDDLIDGRPGSRELGALISDAPLPTGMAASAQWLETRLGRMAAHLNRNQAGYLRRSPTQRRGWAGPYLPVEVHEDPWGHAYLVNVFWLDPRDIVVDLDGSMLGAVWVLSAGPNGVIETPYYQPLDDARLWGDDVGYRLQ